MPYPCPTAGKTEVLYVCFGSKVPMEANLVEVIRFRDGQPAIPLIEFIGFRGLPILEKLPERLEYNQDIDKRFPSGLLPDDYETLWPTK